MSRIWAAVALIAAVVMGAGLQSFVTSNQAVGQGVGNFNFVGNVAGTNTFTAVAYPNYTGNQPLNRFCGYFANSNTGASTLNLSNKGGIQILKGLGNALAADDIIGGQFHCMQLDPTAAYWLLEARGGAGGGPQLNTSNVWISSNVWTALVRTTLTTSIGIGSYCGRPIHYNNAAAGTVTLLAGDEPPPGCAVPIVQENTGQVTIATLAPSAIVGSSSSGCAAHPRTKERWSTIWAEVVNSSPTSATLNISGDCG